MKKILKVLLYIVLGIIVFVIALTVASKLLENKIADAALIRISEVIEAPIEIENVSFNLLRKFPLATIELNNISLKPHIDSLSADTIHVLKQPILKFGKIYLSVSTKALMNNVFEVIKVEVFDADIRYLVNSDSISNIDFLIPPTDTTLVEEDIEETDTVLPMAFTLKELTLKNINLYYNDSTTLTKARINIPQIKLNGKLKGDDIKGKVNGIINISDLTYPETNINLMENTNIGFDLKYSGDSVTINHFTINTDGVEISLDGNTIINDEIKLDLNLNSSQFNIGELIKYAPAEILKEYGVDIAEGIIKVNAKIKGGYSETEMPHVDMNITMEQGRIAAMGYPELKNLSFTGHITNGGLQNNKTTVVNFKNLHVETGKSKIDLSFEVSNLDHLNYKVNTKMDINIPDFKAFIPDSTIESITGRVTANIFTRGRLPDSIGDDFTDYIMANSKTTVAFHNLNIVVDTSLSVKSFNAKINYRPNSFKISALSVSLPEYKVNLSNSYLNTTFNGSINNMQGMSVNIQPLHIEINNSKIHVNLELENLETPTFKYNSEITLNLDGLKPMLPDTLITELSGKFYSKISSHGTIDPDSIENQINTLIFENSSFFMKATDINVAMPDDPLSGVQNFSATIAMESDTIKIDKLHGNYNGMEFWMDSTQIWNMYKTIMQQRRDKELIVQTNVKLGNITNEFMALFMTEDTTNTDGIVEKPGTTQANENIAENNDKTTETTDVTETTKPADTVENQWLLPNFEKLGVPHFLVRGKFAIKSFEYEKNMIEDISLKFRLADSLYVIDLFTFKMCGGVLNTSLKLDARNWEKPVVDIRNTVNNLDIKQLLIDNDNFGDTALTYEKVSGILTSELHTRAFYRDGDWPTRKIRAKGNFMLENGKIHDFKPLVDASVGIGGLKELNKMDFNTLKTSIFMYKDKIYVPRTDIVSNALDLSAFAMHGMTDEIGYEYHLVLHLGDVLTGKSEKLMKSQAKQNKKDGGTVERKGINLISMEIGEEKKNGFDNEKLKKKFKNNLNKQEGFLNLLFNPLLVNFSTELDRSARNKAILNK